ncbi:hypothetical protein AAIG11_16625 [Anoxynatronum sibiricum]|uniref:Uncharacterized protein n=2 Tax=Anoxynatronum sibiricum TaxID=210623 RepID=A0ABU9W0G8_9CLOT
MGRLTVAATPIAAMTPKALPKYREACLAAGTAWQRGRRGLAKAFEGEGPGSSGEGVCRDDKKRRPTSSLWGRLFNRCFHSHFFEALCR